MKLISISGSKHINLDSICSVTAKLYPEFRGDSSSRAVPETVGAMYEIQITTADGNSHFCERDFSARVYDALFPSHES
jgi:hypothetical protein